ncbi:MAG: lipopolysaccharide kinase InaA family protein [Pirellulales bacterium]
MTQFAFDTWDDGRLLVNRQFAPLLERQGWTTFERLMGLGGAVARRQGARETVRLELDAATDASSPPPAFYIKRYGPPPWREYVKPLLRFTRPIVGARVEWDALLEFHRLGLPTMTPVMFGQADRRSFVITQALEGYVKLTEWIDARCPSPDAAGAAYRTAIDKLAPITRTMHNAGVHHQDYYLCHVLVPESSGPPDLHIIDLGRARVRRRLTTRWRVKDLAQLDYSADSVSRFGRLRFLRRYLDRPFRRIDRALVWRIEWKRRLIARHSAKNRL